MVDQCLERGFQRSVSMIKGNAFHSTINQVSTSSDTVQLLLTAVSGFLMESSRTKE